MTIIERIIETKQEELKESSLSRLYLTSRNHDFGCISASRRFNGCDKESGLMTASDKMARHKELAAALRAKGYSVTDIKGEFIEDYGTPSAKHVKEMSLFVIDKDDHGNLKKDLKTFGFKFQQDCVTFQDKNGAHVLISTNKCLSAYPGRGKIGVEVRLGQRMFSEKGDFNSSINGRPFVFKE